MTPSASEVFSRLVTARQSVRAYLPTPVPDHVLHAVMTSARQAPSGCNLQPGAFLKVQGAARERLTRHLTDAWHNGQQEPGDYTYLPEPMPATLKRRQVAAALALYGALDIARDDRTGRNGQFERNFRFFDAPVALVVTIGREFGGGGYLDLGMALYGLMLSAQSHGLATCAIGALASYPSLVRRSLQLDDDTAVVCGLALGYPDTAAPVNHTITTRCELDDYFRVIT